MRTVDVEDERAYWVVLSMAAGIGPVRFQRLLDICGGARRAWQASELQLAAAGLERRTAESLRKLRERTTPAAVARQLAQLKIRALTLLDDEYPAGLRQVADPPPVLFLRGRLATEDTQAVALVGTRRATPYGHAVAARLARDLAASGITVVSGLAKGIDTSAHRATLHAGGRTIAVLGNGLDQVYPPENAGLAREIVDTDAGAVVSEFGPGVPPDAVNFPRRNRIISGLSMGTVIVEAGQRSGALITADFALEQGREVMAVPGSIFSPMSAGPNELLKQGATPVTGGEDILNTLSSQHLAISPEPLARAAPELDPAETTVWQALGGEPRHIDELARSVGIRPGEVSATLAILELRGLARQVGAMLYTLGVENMAKQSLVVVESSAKAKTIEKFLGRAYIVRACMGHVRDLPTSKLGVDVEHAFKPQYVVPKERKDVVKRLKDDARGKTAVLLATDPDREGEAIAWHLVSALGLDGDQPVSRIEFHEVTKGAVLAALNNPRGIDMDRVDAQQARRVVDRLIGYPVSNFLGRKIRRGLSAGRVQSVAVRIIVDREREIRAFVPVEYWSLQAELARRNAGKARFIASLLEREGEKINLHTGVEAASAQAELDGASWSVAGVRASERQQHPDPPFTTSTLQQEASRKLGYTAKRTMMVAQQLYEGIAIGGGDAVGLITYMRTDSVNVAQEALAEVREYIKTRLAAGMLPGEPRAYKTRSKLAQEAHEAIRPTSVYREPDTVRAHLTNEQYRLYDLIWKRFLASQMSSAVFDVTTVDVDAQAKSQPKYRFRASGRRLKFAGFLSLYQAGADEDAALDEERQPLPELNAGDLLDLQRLIPEQHFTQPPPRYTEATLVKFLEERGIGRPSTYAPILSTIQDRGYVERDGRRLTPTELGMLVNDVLVQQFSDIMDPEFTAQLEDKLDEVAQGERQWVPVVQEFYDPLNRDLERANTEVERLKPAEIATDEVCSQGHPMVIKEGRFGRFLACTNYPEHKETRPLPEELPPGAPEEHCSHGVLMQLRTGRYGPFYTSTHDCGETKPFAQRVGVRCPQDGGEILEKRSKKGLPFYPCGNWPDCDWVSFKRPLTEPCPDDGGIQVDMGRGRVRCLKHEGPPPRFAPRAKTAGAAADDGAARPKARGGTRKPPRTTKKVVKASTPARRTSATATARNGTAPARNGAAAAKNGKVASPRRPAAKKA